MPFKIVPILPCRNAVEMWKILCGDTQLVAVMLDHMLELYGKSLPYEEKATDDGREPTRRATQTPLAVSRDSRFLPLFLSN